MGGMCALRQVREMQELLCCDEASAALLLRRHKWDKDKLTDGARPPRWRGWNAVPCAALWHGPGFALMMFLVCSSGSSVARTRLRAPRCVLGSAFDHPLWLVYIDASGVTVPCAAL